MIKRFINKLLGKSEDGTPKAAKTVTARPKAGKRVEVPQAEHGIDPALLDDKALKVVATLQDAGFPRQPVRHDSPRSDGPALEERLHTSADPGRRVHLHIRETGSPGWRFALLFRDWLRTDSAVRSDYLRMKREAAATSDGDPSRYLAAKEPWFDAASPRAKTWAVTSRWVPSLA